MVTAAHGQGGHAGAHAALFIPRASQMGAREAAGGQRCQGLYARAGRAAAERPGRHTVHGAGVSGAADLQHRGVLRAEDEAAEVLVRTLVLTGQLTHWAADALGS